MGRTDGPKVKRRQWIEPMHRMAIGRRGPSRVDGIERTGSGGASAAAWADSTGSDDRTERTESQAKS